VLGVAGRLRWQRGGVLRSGVFGGRTRTVAGLVGGAGDLGEDVPAVGPVAQVAPGFGIALGQRFVIAVGSGYGVGRQCVACGLPQGLGVLQADPGFVELGERAAPVGLVLGCGQRGELLSGEVEEFIQVRADAREGPPGVGVAALLAAPVGEVVQRPALAVDVLVGVVVPLLEDVGGSAGVDGELVQDQLPGGGVDRSEALSAKWVGFQRRAPGVGRVVGMWAASAATALCCLRATARTPAAVLGSCRTVTGPPRAQPTGEAGGVVRWWSRARSRASGVMRARGRRRVGVVAVR